MSVAAQWVLGTLAVLGTLSAGYFGLRGIRHQFSGTIRTTTADTLWKQLEAYSDDLKADLSDARKEIRAVKAQMTHVEKEWQDCRRQCETVKRLVFECEQREKRLMQRLQAAGVDLG